MTENKKIISLTSKQLLLKRMFDVVFSVMILILIAPVLLIISILLKLQNQGPVLYKQSRCSYTGKIFYIYKFRTMCSNAIDEPITQSTVNNDKRISKLGLFLRQTSLDELPQFLNVLQGSMSIVGPRPASPLFVEKYHEHLDYILDVKPGITGWAQINGFRGSTDIGSRASYDLHYCNNWSLWLDIKIISITTFRGFLHKNAY
ncbi:MAG: sugar transferase [Candidatus Pacearchaeota archaeon]|nr:sugar transferase [Candidatus Pacearchaeota archaeon]